MPAFYDSPATYRATTRGWIAGPKVADPRTPLARGAGARLVEAGERFPFDGRPGSWMAAADGDAEAERRCDEAREWRDEQARVASLKANADANGTAVLMAQLAAMSERLAALEGTGGKHKGKPGGA
jgi:hypothetical protein